MSKLDPAFEAVPFDALEGWDGDDHAAAFSAFLKSCGPVLAAAGMTTKTAPPSPQLLAVCKAALSFGRPLGSTEARKFFETHFQPHRVVHDGAPGLLTGYYEPLVDGARERGGDFQVPVYRRPSDLVNLVAESERGALAHGLTHARKTAGGTEPYSTRQEIEEGALEGLGLELLWLADPVDCFFMHIQGSGRVRLRDGSMVRITYDGKNGHPYTSIGRYLIDAGLFPADRMSLDALKEWLKRDAVQGRNTMWQNKSFVFFRELEGDEAGSALGVNGIALSDGRSLAVDTAFHTIGTPVYVTAPTLTHGGQAGGFRRLMIAQDVGSAIRGPERGDIYFGSGAEAGKLAGITKHGGKFFVLLPRAGLR